eukprot:jgi/Hompol1/2039/HPOL_005827-RA
MIAEHFSATRYKPWPVVDNFLRSVFLQSAKPRVAPPSS